MSPAVIVITESQRRASADGGTLLAQCKFDQPLINHGHRVLVQFVCETLELLLCKRRSNGWLRWNCGRLFPGHRALGGGRVLRARLLCPSRRYAQVRDAEAQRNGQRGQKTKCTSVSRLALERISAAEPERDKDTRQGLPGLPRPEFPPSSHRSNRRDDQGSTENAGHILYELSQYHLANACKCLCFRVPTARHWD